jgi:hypothetical protein
MSLVRTILILSLIFGSSSQALSQSNFFQEDLFNLETDMMSGFSDDGRMKVLMLNLAPYGMTETAAGEISKALQLSIFNTNHFTVVGPSEWNAQIQERDPSLADCNDIACGVLVGKLFRADKVLVGSIRNTSVLGADGETQGFQMDVRLVDVLTNATDYTDQILFTDAQMHEEFFMLAQRLSKNTELQGYVTSLTNNSIVADLGVEHGLEMGAQLVIFRREADLLSSGDSEVSKETNIAIARVHRISQGRANAIIVQQLEEVREGDYVKTYLDVSKQIQLISNTRRELDTQKRLEPSQKEFPLQPELIITDRDLWLQRLQISTAEEERWMIATLGTGTGTLLLFSGRLELAQQSEGVGQLLPWIVGAAFGYSGYQYIQARNFLSGIKAEGEIKDFANNWQFHWNFKQNQPNLVFNYQF